MSPRPMPRPYAMARLLEHGALTTEQLREITGWDSHIVTNVLQTLLGDGTVASANLDGRRHYLLTADLAALGRRTVGRPKGSTRDGHGAANANANARRANSTALAHNPFNLNHTT